MLSSIPCCTDHNQCHETFSCNKDSMCMLPSAYSAIYFRHIESVLIVFHTLTILCCCQTQDGYSPVNVASLKGHTEVVDLLVQAGADIHLATSDEVHVSTHIVSSSIAAVVETNVRLLEFVVRSTTMISTSTNCSLVSHTLKQFGSVPLETAAGKGHTKTVQRLLEAGANVNHQNKVMTVNVVFPCK